MEKSNRPMADYVKLPSFDEYREWFKDYFDLKREDGILQVTMKTGDGPMCWSGGAHRAMSQLSRIISLDHENQIIIWTHIGDDWMQDFDYNGWDRYGAERFEHQYYDDTNLIKNMVFDIDVPTIGAMTGPGFHWDSAMLCDITIVAEDCKFEDPHLSSGMVPGDCMGLLLQHFLGEKRANYLLYTGGQIDAKTALNWGLVSEVAPKKTVLDRAWEVARIIKSAPYEARTITSQICKRPLEHVLVNDMKLNNLCEAYSTQLLINKGGLGNPDSEQVDERYQTAWWRWRCSKDSNDELLNPRTLAGKVGDRKVAMDWYEKEFNDKER